MNTDTVRTPGCPPWCVEHYPTSNGGGIHIGAPLAVTGASADDDSPVPVSVWVELREFDGGPGAVGVLEKTASGDVELCPCQLRAFARHLVTVAEQVEAAGGDVS